MGVTSGRIKIVNFPLFHRKREVYSRPGMLFYYFDSFTEAPFAKNLLDL